MEKRRRRRRKYDEAGWLSAANHERE